MNMEHIITNCIWCLISVEICRENNISQDRRINLLLVRLTEEKKIVSIWSWKYRVMVSVGVASCTVMRLL